VVEHPGEEGLVCILPTKLKLLKMASESAAVNHPLSVGSFQPVMS
jgi:hypothetical protein